MKLIANIDGASLGNPGPCGIGIVLQDPGGKVLREHFENIGMGTNNRAEYMALLKSLELVGDMGATEIEVRSDSLLVVSQMNGDYKVKNADIKVLVKRIPKHNKGFENRIQNISRSERNEQDGGQVVEERRESWIT